MTPIRPARAAAEDLRARIEANDTANEEGARSVKAINESVGDVMGSPNITGVTDSDGDGLDDDGKVQVEVDGRTACVTLPATGEDTTVESGDCSEKSGRTCRRASAASIGPLGGQRDPPRWLHDCQPHVRKVLDLVLPRRLQQLGFGHLLHPHRLVDRSTAPVSRTRSARDDRRGAGAGRRTVGISSRDPTGLPGVGRVAHFGARTLTHRQTAAERSDPRSDEMQREVANAMRIRMTRKRAGLIASAVATCALAGQLAGVGLASANAPDPRPDIVGIAKVNADGTVTADLSGTWTWPGQSCAGRWGQGWALDWWGISSSSMPSSNFPLTNASVVTSTGATTKGTITAAGSWAIGGKKKNAPAGQYFHVSQMENGANNNTPGNCTDTPENKGSTGKWAATATYPNLASIPPQVCVIHYDIHGNPGSLSKPSDLSSLANGDNSIKTNQFDPTAGKGYCVTLTVVPPPPPSTTTTTTAAPSSTLTGHIYRCDNGVQTALEVPGGRLAATGAGNVARTSNPLNPTTVPAGSYTMFASAPAGYEFATCGGSAKLYPPDAATFVNVPAGGNGVGVFYVTPKAPEQPKQTLTGHIYACDNGAPTTTEVPGGRLSATGPTNVPITANPVGPQPVAAGAYTLFASAPTGYQFVACGGNAKLYPPDAVTFVNVPAGGTGVGTFYVMPTPVS